MSFTAAPARTLANAAMIEGFFAFMWFGWGQEGPPDWVGVVLVVGAVLAVGVVVSAIVAFRRTRGEPSPLSGPEDGKRYGIIVGTEFAAAGLGAMVLGVVGYPEFIAAWICLVVGVHFVPLDRLFPGIGMIGLAVAVSAVGVAAFVVGATTSLLPSTVAGLGAGACLLGHSAALLLRGGRARSDAQREAGSRSSGR